MGAPDANGSYIYDGSELVPNTGFDDVLNLAQSAESAQFAARFPVKAVAAGVGIVTIAAGVNYGNIGIAFPVGRFTQVPLVIASVVRSDGNYFTAHADATDLATGFAIVRRFTGAAAAGGETVQIHWVALQMTAGVAAG